MRRPLLPAYPVILLICLILACSGDDGAGPVVPEGGSLDGVELFVADDAAHGASMLNPERSKDVEATWERLLEFLREAGTAEAR